jgi:hypothetical protein
MGRIAGLAAERAGWLARLGYWFSMRRFGRVVEPLAVAAHHGGILFGYSAYELALDRAQLVDKRLKVLASLKVAALVGCPF